MNINFNQLSSYITVATSQETLDDINGILSDARVDYSFFGEKVIRQGNQTISLSEIAAKVSTIAITITSHLNKNPEQMTREMKDAWDKVAETINEYYSKSEETKKSKNFITQIFIFIRDYAFPDKCRDNYENGNVKAWFNRAFSTKTDTAQVNNSAENNSAIDTWKDFAKYYHNANLEVQYIVRISTLDGKSPRYGLLTSHLHHQIFISLLPTETNEDSLSDLKGISKTAETVQYSDDTLNRENAGKTGVYVVPLYAIESGALKKLEAQQIEHWQYKQKTV